MTILIKLHLIKKTPITSSKFNHLHINTRRENTKINKNCMYFPLGG